MSDEKDLQYVVKLQNEINKKKSRSLDEVKQSVDLDSLSSVLDLEKTAEPDLQQDDSFDFGEQLLNLNTDSYAPTYGIKPERPAMPTKMIMQQLVDAWKSHHYSNDVKIKVRGTGDVTDIEIDGDTITLKAE